MNIIDGIPVWGDPIQNAVDQMKNCAKSPHVRACGLMADHHLGYAVPIGGVIGYDGYVSPSGVGFDIACGNKAVRLEGVTAMDLNSTNLERIMDDIVSQISFGVGRINKTEVDNDLFDHEDWGNIPILAEHKDMARAQLGTVGSGNHYIDVFLDEQMRVWIGCHFGSRGLGHKIATHYIKAGGGKDGINVDPVEIKATSDLGYEYIHSMWIAGHYAYAGRDWVCQTVADIIGAPIVEEIHNHHNFAWLEDHPEVPYTDDKLWVVRKGATPARPGQKGFVGGTMGEQSVILEGVESPESAYALYSTVHGAGRMMSRTAAAGKTRWKKGQRVRISEGVITQEMMDGATSGIVRRGGGRDEAPQAYKRLPEVLEAQGATIKILHYLTPVGVAMAGEGEYDPYKD